MKKLQTWSLTNIYIYFNFNIITNIITNINTFTLHAYTYIGRNIHLNVWFVQMDVCKVKNSNSKLPVWHQHPYTSLTASAVKISPKHKGLKKIIGVTSVSFIAVILTLSLSVCSLQKGSRLHHIAFKRTDVPLANMSVCLLFVFPDCSNLFL